MPHHEVYEYLNYPELTVVGETASTVGRSEKPVDFITLFGDEDRLYDGDSIENVLSDDTKVHIFGLGACDLYHVMGHFSMPNQNLVYECNVFMGNHQGVNTGTEYIRSMLDMNET